MSESASEPARDSAELRRCPSATALTSDRSVSPAATPLSASGPPSPASVPPSLNRSAYRSAASWFRFLIPAAIGLGLDLLLKSWAFPEGVPAPSLAAHIPAGRNPAELYDPTPLIPHVLGFTTTVNHGAVFGLGQGLVFFFLIFSLFAMSMILWVFLTSKRDQWVVHIALGMITAGALGNLYDRAVFQGVRDMLRFLCFHFPPIHVFGSQFPSGAIAADGTIDWYPYIFNIADVMLCVGVPLLMLRWLMVKEPAGVEDGRAGQ